MIHLETIYSNDTTYLTRYKLQKCWDNLCLEIPIISISEMTCCERVYHKLMKFVQRVIKEKVRKTKRSQNGRVA